jgi:hypothetical protein
MPVAFPEEEAWSFGLASGSFSNPDSKHARHTPLALTGVVHLLYLFPQVLQMAMAVAGLTRIRRENPVFNCGFSRPNPLAFLGADQKNAGHDGELYPTKSAKQTPNSSLNLDQAL